MSALNGMGIHNLIVEVDGSELPGLDGSSLEFVQALEKVGIQEQESELECFDIKERLEWKRMARLFMFYLRMILKFRIH